MSSWAHLFRDCRLSTRLADMRQFTTRIRKSERQASSVPPKTDLLRRREAAALFDRRLPLQRLAVGDNTDLVPMNFYDVLAKVFCSAFSASPVSRALPLRLLHRQSQHEFISAFIRLKQLSCGCARSRGGQQLRISMKGN